MVPRKKTWSTGPFKGLQSEIFPMNLAIKGRFSDLYSGMRSVKSQLEVRAHVQTLGWMGRKREASGG